MVNNLNVLTNGDQCKIDAKLIGELGANVVRVYSVDPTLEHDECMKAFDDAGIYVIVDMSTPVYYINRVRFVHSLQEGSYNDWEWTTDRGHDRTIRIGR